MKHLVYDIECYRNLFHLVTWDIYTKEYQTYTNNDRLLNEIIRNSEIILIGWNNHSYDDLLLNYIAEQAVPTTNGWDAQAALPTDTKTLWELSQQGKVFWQIIS